MPTPRSSRENFLADAVSPRGRQLTYADGFRFGLGFVVASLLVWLVLGGLTWAVILLLKLS